jgi:hypothetical protein
MARAEEGEVETPGVRSTLPHGGPGQALACLKKQGGLDASQPGVDKDRGLGNDGIWTTASRGRRSWYFRGFPHVHVGQRRGRSVGGAERLIDDLNPRVLSFSREPRRAPEARG